MEQHEINERIRKKVEESDLDETIKKFLLNIIEFEISEGLEDRGSIRFAKYYRTNIDATYIKQIKQDGKNN